LVARLLEARPEKVKEEMIAILKKMKEGEAFFQSVDFEEMFDSFDAFGSRGNGQIPVLYLMQALRNINIWYTQE
jgi:hypothetical protein